MDWLSFGLFNTSADGLFEAYRELLDYIIPFNEKHLRRLLYEYIDQYYNPSRTHQGIKRQTPILSEEPGKTAIIETSLISEPVLNGLYHNYRKAA